MTIRKYKSLLKALEIEVIQAGQIRCGIASSFKDRFLIFFDIHYFPLTYFLSKDHFLHKLTSIPSDSLFFQHIFTPLAAPLRHLKTGNILLVHFLETVVLHQKWSAIQLLQTEWLYWTVQIMANPKAIIKICGYCSQIDVDVHASKFLMFFYVFKDGNFMLFYSPIPHIHVGNTSKGYLFLDYLNILANFEKVRNVFASF